MSLIDTIRRDQIAARKAKDSAAIGVLTALIGEATAVGKNAGNREPTDEEVTAMIRKFLKNANDLLYAVAARSPDGEEVTKAKAEIALLTAYLPRQMTADELRHAVAAFKAANPGAPIGAVMGHLKATYAGRYNGKLAAEIAKA